MSADKTPTQVLHEIIGTLDEAALNELDEVGLAADFYIQSKDFDAEFEKRYPNVGIQPGDIVGPSPEHHDQGLDSRQVVAVGLDWITLDIWGTETARLPKDNYQVIRRWSPEWRPMYPQHTLRGE